MNKARKTLDDIQLDKIKLVRLSHHKQNLPPHYSKMFTPCKRYEVLNNRLKTDKGNTIQPYDLRNLIHRKVLTVICV